MLPAELTGKYEARGTLGAGAMGTVVEAFDRMIERRVAIKVVKLPAGGDAEAEEAHVRFRREAQAAGRLSHPNIVAVYDYGENADTAWIVMELVEGGSLKALLDGGERLPVAETVRLMEQILAALTYSHGRGVVHRDIKPANIMLTGDQAVKIADYGIARIESSTMTQVGTVMGTPSYMAPEQLRGEPVDARADIWAAGVVLYQFLTGEKPFEGNYTALMHRIMNSEPLPPSQLAVSAPRGFDTVIARALAKRPDDRFPSAAAFAEAIREAAAGAASPQPAARGFAGAGPLPGLDDATMVAGAGRAPASPLPRAEPPPAATPAAPPAAPKRGNTGLIVGGSVAALAAAGIGAFVLMRPGTPPTPPAQPAQIASAPAPVQAALPAPAAPAPVVAVPAPSPAAPPVVAAPSPAAPQPAVAPLAPAQPSLPPTLTAIPAPPWPDFRAGARAAASAAPCSLLEGVPGEGGVTVSGVLRRGGEEAVRRALAERGVTGRAAIFESVAFDGPYCEALDVVRQVAAAFGEAPGVNIMGRLPLQRGDLLQLEVQMPERAGYLYVSYLMKSNEIAHLVPSHPQQAGARVRLGEPRPGFPGWEVDEPYGTDMIVVFVSERPLFTTPRPQMEPLDSFVPALSAALRTAREQGVRVSARAVVLETVEQR
jgi:serine/threonine-protein kinase